MIAYFHTEDFSTMIGTDNIPRIGEKIRIPAESSIPDERDGLFIVDDVIYEVPSNGRQRVDLYGRRIGDAPRRLGYETISELVYKFKLKEMSR